MILNVNKLGIRKVTYIATKICSWKIAWGSTGYLATLCYCYEWRVRVYVRQALYPASSIISSKHYHVVIRSACAPLCGNEPAHKKLPNVDISNKISWFSVEKTFN